MTLQEPHCTEASHPPVFRYAGQESLYKKILASLAKHESSGVSPDAVMNLLVTEFGEVLARPSDYVEDGLRVQGIRRDIASIWGDVLYKLENLANLLGWCIIGCIRQREESELHAVQGLLLLQAIRNVFATVSQMRSGLATDTLGYLRTVHEVYVKSEFLDKHSTLDRDLPGRFLYYNNTTYLENYRRFASNDDAESLSETSWAKADQYFSSRFRREGKGDYGWAYPKIVSKNGKPEKRPTLSHLIDDLGVGAHSHRMSYEISSSDVHGEFLFGGFIDHPPGVGSISVYSFSTAWIDSILDEMVPMFGHIVENTASSCSIPKQTMVMDVAKAICEDISQLVTQIVKGGEKSGRVVSMVRINVRLSGQHKCHLCYPRG